MGWDAPRLVVLAVKCGFFSTSILSLLWARCLKIQYLVMQVFHMIPVRRRSVGREEG